ncbi:hypothetical protein KC19_2G249100 [Ceratodon purpureus]|uniref:Protein kinase domain-containing protein n=1 Tax=Ceratodon purpureus TaxID=3225 RepID=A0A8T0J0H3_CERPU|nr:hypothetical protein KC19_2G249100 [Ceratodon purpureus]KAG0588517.1 hypothetical protein KC19_2G249100 [Ceratodon purpureus]
MQGSSFRERSPSRVEGNKEQLIDTRGNFHLELIALDSKIQYHILLCLIFLLAFSVLSAGGESTQITFPYFSAADNIIAFGDAGYNADNRSFVINGGASTHSTGTCGELLYGKNVRIQEIATGKVASFSTSFSFSFTTPPTALVWDNFTSNRDGSGFAFAFLQSTFLSTMQDLVSQMGRSGGCKSSRSEDLQSSKYPPGFALYIDTDFNPNHNEPSNNFLRISKNLDSEYDIPAYTYNLCGNETHCCYFSNGRIFTAWIDFSSSSQTLEVRLANGSNPSVKKPSSPLILIPNYKMSKQLGDDVYLTFWGSSDINHVEAHELLSWSFSSSGISTKTPSSAVLLQYSKARKWAGLTIGILGTVATFLVLWSISWLARPSRNHSCTKLGYPSEPRVFSYKELRKATENFDERNLLGSGGSGSVYRGSLEPGGILVAVKQINYESKHAQSFFHSEISSLGQIRHRNVVQLHGWCQEKGRLLLVYDFMPNGGLNEWLHQSGSSFKGKALTLKMRRDILEGLAAALEYLHEDCLSCVLHRDIKSSNVMLDADFKAHLGDFGLARLMDHNKLEKTTLAAGTLGYMAPEMPYTGKATKESDVYSFGILVLEVMCGRRPLDMQAVEPEDLVLLYSVWRAHEAGALLSVADPRLLQDFQPLRSKPLQAETNTYAAQTPDPLTSNSHNLTDNVPVLTLADDIEVQKAIVVQLLHLGLLCCLPNPKARPSMAQVNRILHQIRDMESISAVTNISMPSLPTTKPPGLYRSLEFSQTELSASSSRSPVSSAQVHCR